MAGFSQSQGFKGKSELKANPPSESMKFSMLLFCALVLITVLFGLTQALALFFLPPNSNGLLPSHLSWLYFVFSSVLFVLYIHHVISLLEGNSSEQENSSFLLFHSYLNLFVDIAFLTYAFCLPLGNTRKHFISTFNKNIQLFRIRYCFDCTVCNCPITNCYMLHLYSIYQVHYGHQVNWVD